MSIVRIGLSETKQFAEGYDAIFGKKDRETTAKKKPATEQASTFKKKKSSKKK